MDIPDSPWMTGEEIAFLNEQVHPTDRMCEWGAGGSTIWLDKRVDTLVALEHDEDWYRALMERIANEPQVSPSLYFIDGAPDPPVTAMTDAVRAYLEDGLYYGGERHGPFDVVLVDGRARLYVAMKMRPYLREGGHLLIHDWDRDRYHDALEWYDLESVVGSLAALKPAT